MNRRKPKVVIPAQVEQLIATGERVADAVGSGGSIVGNRLAGEVSQLRTACQQAKDLTDSRRTMYESSQQARSIRDDVNGEIYDVLAQARDYAQATSNAGAGEIGFEVVESNGSVSVSIPRNPDEFVALAERVVSLTAGDNDEVIAGLRVRLESLVAKSKEQQNTSISKRERAQLLVRNRNNSASQITDILRRIRDVGFGIAGPYRYEELSTMGFVVQSTETQRNGTTETSEQDLSAGLEENESEDVDSESWNSGPFVPEGGTESVTPNRFWLSGDPIPESVTEIEDVYRYTNTIPSEYSPFWTFGPHHQRYGQIPVTGSEVLRAFELARSSEFFTGDRLNLTQLQSHHIPKGANSPVALEQSLEMWRAACVLRGLRIGRNGAAFGQGRNDVVITEKMAREGADRLSLSGPVYEPCDHACEVNGVAGNVRLVRSNNRWQPGDVIPQQVGGDGEIDCFTHTFSNIGVGENEVPLEYQRTHVQFPRKGVTKTLLRRYYDKALRTACGSVALTGENGNLLPGDDTSFVSVDCVTESFQRDVQFINDGVADHEFSFSEVEYRSMLYLQVQINATNNVTGDIDDRLFRTDVEQFIDNLDDNFILNILCVSVITNPQTRLEVEQELALSGCVDRMDDGSLRLNPVCVCEQFGQNSRHCSFATDNDRDGGQWPIDGSEFQDEGGNYSVLTILSDGDLVTVTQDGVEPPISGQRLIDALGNLGNDNVTMDDLGLSDGDFVTERSAGETFRSIPLSGPVTSEELNNALDALRNIPPEGSLVAVPVGVLGQIAVEEGLASDGDIYIGNLGLDVFDAVYVRTFLAYGGQQSTFDFVPIPVTVEQLIDEEAELSDILMVDLELGNDAIVSREQLLPFANEAYERAWYKISGARIPDNAFSTVDVNEFVESFDALDVIGIFAPHEQVNRHQLIQLDAEEGDESPAAVEAAFYALF